MSKTKRTLRLIIDEHEKRLEIVELLSRIIPYIRGYLPNAKIEMVEDFSENPIWCLVKVYYKDEVTIDVIPQVVRIPKKEEVVESETQG